MKSIWTQDCHGPTIVPVLGDIRDGDHFRKVFESYAATVVFHAAAYKHVPMLEIQPWKALDNNITGTLNLWMWHRVRAGAVCAGVDRQGGEISQFMGAQAIGGMIILNERLQRLPHPFHGRAVRERHW